MAGNVRTKLANTYHGDGMVAQHKSKAGQHEKGKARSRCNLRQLEDKWNKKGTLG